MLIDLFSSDLVAGYKEIVNARQALLTKWRVELLRAYSKKRDRYNQQLAQREARKAQYERFLPFIGALLLVVCGIGAWMTFRSVDMVCLGMFLMVGTGFGALLALTPWMGLSRTPPPPENPVTRTSQDEDESPLRQRLFPKLVPLWRRELALRIPTEEEAEQMAADTGRWGLIGEFDLIRALEQVVSPDTYILHSLKPTSSDDMDVVVIGPKGFWYFEVKHWNADFVWQGGTWEVWQFDPTTQSFEPVPVQRISRRAVGAHAERSSRQLEGDRRECSQTAQKSAGPGEHPRRDRVLQPECQTRDRPLGAVPLRDHRPVGRRHTRPRPASKI